MILLLLIHILILLHVIDISADLYDRFNKNKPRLQTFNEQVQLAEAKLDELVVKAGCGGCAVEHEDCGIRHTKTT